MRGRNKYFVSTRGNRVAQRIARRYARFRRSMRRNARFRRSRR